MILHALEEAGSNLLLGMAFVCAGSVIVIALALTVLSAARRADARERREVERERERYDRQLLDADRHRSEMRSYNARPTASERWGGLV